MKIAITGHTAGIGEGVYKFYKKQGFECLGFSRTNGYNVGMDYHRIVEEAKTQ